MTSADEGPSNGTTTQDVSKVSYIPRIQMLSRPPSSVHGPADRFTTWFVLSNATQSIDSGMSTPSAVRICSSSSRLIVRSTSISNSVPPYFASVIDCLYVTADASDHTT